MYRLLAVFVFRDADEGWGVENTAGGVCTELLKHHSLVGRTIHFPQKQTMLGERHGLAFFLLSYQRVCQKCLSNILCKVPKEGSAGYQDWRMCFMSFFFVVGFLQFLLNEFLQSLSAVHGFILRIVKLDQNHKINPKDQFPDRLSPKMDQLGAHI